MPASLRRVIPIAHNGASCGSRELPRVSRLVSKAMPATPSVKVFNADVTAKVRLKIRVEFGFQRRLIQQVAAVQSEFVLQRR